MFQLLLLICLEIWNFNTFFKAGVEHFGSGRRSGSLMLMRGFPEPGSHAERRRALDKLEERKLAKIGDEAFLYLHSYGYYGGEIFPEVDKCLKDVDEAIRYVHRKIGKTP